jgi:hypothetical protein
VQLSKSASIGIGAAAAGIVILATIASVTLFPARTPTVADLLPANRTVAVVSARTAEHAAWLRSWLGIPLEIAAFDDASLAIIKDGAANGWVLLRPSPEGSIDPFIVTASSPALLQSLQEDERLGDAETFRLLSRDIAPDDSWAYADPASGRDVLRGWAVIDAPFLVTLEANTVSLRLPRADDAIATTLLLRSVISDAVRSAFGSDVSLEYDIKPLLIPDGTLHLHTGSGSLQFAMHGRMSDATETARLLDSLHEHGSAGQATVRREQRDFGDGLTMDTLRADGQTGKEEREEVNGWDLRVAAGGFATAQAGRVFAVGSDAAILRPLLASPADRQPAPLSVTGMVDGRVLGNMVRSALPFSEFFNGGRMEIAGKAEGRIWSVAISRAAR